MVADFVRLCVFHYRSRYARIRTCAIIIEGSNFIIVVALDLLLALSYVEWRVVESHELLLILLHLI